MATYAAWGETSLISTHLDLKKYATPGLCSPLFVCLFPPHQKVFTSGMNDHLKRSIIIFCRLDFNWFRINFSGTLKDFLFMKN